LKPAEVCTGESSGHSIAWKEGEDLFRERAEKIRNYGAAVIVMVSMKKDKPLPWKEEKQFGQRAYDILTRELKFPPEGHYF